MRLGEVDPWLGTHLRLARARGSLQAPNSAVQDEALNILDMLDASERERTRTDTVKALLALADEERVAAYFPEYFAPEEKLDPLAGAYDEEGNLDIDKVDDEAIDWGAPATPEEDADLSAWIEQRERAGGVTFTAGDQWI